MKEFYWIASYPKSGNTWVRTFLAHAVFGNIASLADVDKVLPCAISNGWDVRNQTSERTFVKTHKIFENTRNGNIPKGCVYLVRNPLDIVFSAINFQKLTFPGVSNLSDDEIISFEKKILEEFCCSGGLISWIKAGYGNWVDNVSSWTNQNNIPTFVLKYEDLVENPEDKFAKILEFLNITKSQEELTDLINISSFFSMKTMENNEINGIIKAGGFVKNQTKEGYSSGFRFLNQGKPNQYIDKLDNQVIENLRNKFKPIIKNFGY